MTRCDERGENEIVGCESSNVWDCARAGDARASSTGVGGVWGRSSAPVRTTVDGEPRVTVVTVTVTVADDTVGKPLEASAGTRCDDGGDNVTPPATSSVATRGRFANGEVVSGLLRETAEDGDAAGVAIRGATRPTPRSAPYLAPRRPPAAAAVGVFSFAAEMFI